MDFHENKCNCCGIKIEHLTVTKNGVFVLDDVNLVLHCGDILSLIGRNGAGKTTLIKAILGEIKYEGKITFVDSRGCSVKNPKIGYIPQSLQFDKNSPVTVSDFLGALQDQKPVFCKKLYKKNKFLDKVGCSNLINHKLSDLSGGEIQRIALAAAINPLPNLLIFDEPLSATDLVGMEIFYETLLNLRSQNHISVLLVVHDFKSIKKHSNIVAILDKTVLKCGSLNYVFASKEFKQLIGAQINV